VQTQRLPLYAEALEQLKANERVYPCTCTRSDVAAAASAPHVGQEGPIYPGTCAYRTVANNSHLGESDESITRSVMTTMSWRLRTRDTARHFVDRVAGFQSCNVAAELGDFVVAKANGTPAYQLAVVVDDHAMGVTEVLRGDDLLPSAFRQLELYEFFGWTPPEFAHVPLVVGPDGRRLAKRHGDTRLATLRAAGMSPQTLVGMLAHSCALIDRPEDVQPCDLLAGFDLAKLPRQKWVFRGLSADGG